MPLQADVLVTWPTQAWWESTQTSPEAHTLEVKYVGDLIDVPAGCKAARWQSYAHDELVHLCMGAAAEPEVSRVCQACALKTVAQDAAAGQTVSRQCQTCALKDCAQAQQQGRHLAGTAKHVH